MTGPSGDKSGKPVTNVTHNVSVQNSAVDCEQVVTEGPSSFDANSRCIVVETFAGGARLSKACRSIGLDVEGIKQLETYKRMQFCMHTLRRHAALPHGPVVGPSLDRIRNLGRNLCDLRFFQMVCRV